MTDMTKNEFRFEGHYYRWTVIDSVVIRGVKYSLAESSIGDEAPYIVFREIITDIKPKQFTNKCTGDVTTMLYVPAKLIIDDEVYDGLECALEDHNIL